VAAAAERFHQQGYANTALADVARAAGVAAGNVFYYFRTKDDLALAVVEEWVSRLTGYMASLEASDSAWLRLERFIDQAAVQSEMYVTLGCPLAGLTRDLRHASPDLQTVLSRIYAVQYGWLGTQFRELGFAPVEADAQARFLLAGYHGAILLAYTQGDPGLIEGSVQDLKSWLSRLQETSRRRS
jgi:AcrR family transcriptional regulator